MRHIDFLDAYPSHSQNLTPTLPSFLKRHPLIHRHLLEAPNLQLSCHSHLVRIKRLPHDVVTQMSLCPQGVNHILLALLLGVLLPPPPGA